MGSSNNFVKDRSYKYVDRSQILEGSEGFLNSLSHLKSFPNLNILWSRWYAVKSWRFTSIFPLKLVIWKHPIIYWLLDPCYYQGHHVEVQLTGNAITRTKFQCHWFDQTRVVDTPMGEENFKVFYQMLAGLTHEERGWSPVCILNIGCLNFDY